MKKIDKTLQELVSSMKGKMIGIGLDSPLLLDEIDRNDQITECILLNDRTQLLDDTRGGKKKKISIRKIRKKFKKKRIDYILCSIEEIKLYMKTFVKDSIYITKGTIYYYGNDLDTIEILKERYGRYTVDWKEEKIGSYDLVTIKVGSAKNHRIKEFFYYIKDSLMNGVDYLSDYLIH